jgi:hypothetical protein
MGELRNTYKILVGNPEGEGPLLRPSGVDGEAVL